MHSPSFFPTYHEQGFYLVGSIYLAVRYVLLLVRLKIRQPGVSNIPFLAPAKASLFEHITLSTYQELIKATPGHEILAPGSARKSYNRELLFVSFGSRSVSS